VGGVGVVNPETIRSAGLRADKWVQLMNMFDEDKSGRRSMGCIPTFLFFFVFVFDHKVYTWFYISILSLCV
jgi:hypothetical protein